MTKQELKDYLSLEQSQKSLNAEYQRNQIQLDSLRQKARHALRSSVSTDDAIFELDSIYYRLFIDSDDEIQVSIIPKILS